MKAEANDILPGSGLQPERTAEIIFRDGNTETFRVILPLNCYRPKGFLFYDKPVILRKNDKDAFLHIMLQVGIAEKVDFKRVLYEKIEIVEGGQKTQTRQEHAESEKGYFDKA